MTFDEVVAQTQEKARLIARQEEHQPIVLLVHVLVADGDMVAPVVPVTIRGLPRAVLPEILATHQPAAYILVVEARIQAGGPLPAYEGAIANNPRNPECLMMVACARGGPARSWKANIWPATDRAARRRGEREVGVWEEAQGGLQVAGALVIENW